MRWRHLAVFVGVLSLWFGGLVWYEKHKLRIALEREDRIFRSQVNMLMVSRGRPPIYDGGL